MSFDQRTFANNFSLLEKKFIELLGDSYQSRIQSMQKQIEKGDTTYQDCSDILFLYLALCKAAISEDYEKYDIFESARILPTFINLSQKWEKLLCVANVNDKLELLVNKKKSPEVDSILFELLVAAKYVELGFKVKFVPETPHKKTPDLLITNNNESRFVECKKMQRGSEYAQKSNIHWDDIYKRLANLLSQKKIRGHFHLSFLSKPNEIKPNKILRKILKKEKQYKKKTKPFFVTKNSELTIQYTPIPDSKFNVEIDPARNITGPSFIHYLLDCYHPHIHYRCIQSSTKEQKVFATNIDWATVISFSDDCSQSQDLKAQHLKRILSKASKQLSENSSGDIHILVEEADGLSVYEKRLKKNSDQIVNFQNVNGKIQRIYLHIAKFIVPPSQQFDVEETIQCYKVAYCEPEQGMDSVWYHSESIEKGLGTLMNDYL